jgi:hypothetical protein
MKGTCSMHMADDGFHIIVGGNGEVTEGQRNRCVEYEILYMLTGKIQTILS